MNLLLDFDKRELSVLYLSACLLHNNLESDDEAPQDLFATAKSVVDKLETIIQLRVEQDEKFQSLVESSLADTQNESLTIINNYNETENN